MSHKPQISVKAVEASFFPTPENSATESLLSSVATVILSSDDYDSDDDDASDGTAVFAVAGAVILGIATVAAIQCDASANGNAKYRQGLDSAFNTHGAKVAHHYHSQGLPIPREIAIQACEEKETLKPLESKAGFKSIFSWLGKHQTCKERVDEKGADHVFDSAFERKEDGSFPANKMHWQMEFAKLIDKHAEDITYECIVDAVGRAKLYGHEFIDSALVESLQSCHPSTVTR